MSKYTLSKINIYPVKSLPGIELKESIVEERGFKYDRRWMLVDSNNTFITQRLFPQMIFITPSIVENHLIFMHKFKDIKSLRISLNEFPNKEIKVQIWDDECFALEYESEINNWFSAAIDFQCKLVYMPGTSYRKTSTKYFKESKNVSFADGYPYLIIGMESLNHLNKMLIKPVEMNQFRPNLVFEGGNKHDEDNWKEISIGFIRFAVVKPCARCVITTIDLKSGKKNKEPLSTLNTYRDFDKKIMFGQNAIALSHGILKIGEKINILKS